MLKMRHGVRSILCGPLTVKGVANEYARRSRSVSSHHTMPYGRSPALGARGRHTPGDRHTSALVQLLPRSWLSDGARRKRKGVRSEHEQSQGGSRTPPRLWRCG